MSSGKIKTNCGLIVGVPQDLSDEAHEARFTLAKNLAAQTDWGEDHWYGYLMAVGDVSIEINPDLIKPDFVSLSEEIEKSENPYILKDLYDALGTSDLVYAAQMGSYDFLKINNGETSQPDAEKEYFLNVAAMLREKAEAIEAYANSSDFELISAASDL